MPTFIAYNRRRGRAIWRYSAFANFLDGISMNGLKNGRYSVFQSSDGDGKIQYLIENYNI